PADCADAAIRFLAQSGGALSEIQGRPCPFAALFRLERQRLRVYEQAFLERGLVRPSGVAAGLSARTRQSKRSSCFPSWSVRGGSDRIWPIARPPATLRHLGYYHRDHGRSVGLVRCPARFKFAWESRGKGTPDCCLSGRSDLHGVAAVRL